MARFADSGTQNLQGLVSLSQTQTTDTSTQLVLNVATTTAQVQRTSAVDLGTIENLRRILAASKRRYTATLAASVTCLTARARNLHLTRSLRQGTLTAVRRKYNITL